MNYDLDYLFTMFGKSDLCLIGYDTISESIKDELLDKLNVLRLGKVNSDFTIKSHLRDLKISCVLNNSPINMSNIIHLDINDIEIESESTDSFLRNKKVHNLIEFIRNKLSICNYKCIITTQTYKSFNKPYTIINYVGGNRILYSSDFAITLQNKSAKIVKSRYDSDNINIDISDLKNFNYICNYEYSK